MANKGLFASARGKLVPPTDTKNEAGGRAYKRTDEEALAVYAATGCLNQTFYATGEEQLAKMLEHAQGCTDSFIARCAVYARQSAFMKDMPALLCAVLAARKSPWLAVSFPMAIDNPRMLRNFVQIVRSGVTGRKSLGSAPRRLVRQWLMCRSPDGLFRASVGQDPSIADVIKMVHPKPEDPARAALYAYLIGKPVESLSMLPKLVHDYEHFKRQPAAARDFPVPNVPFQMLTALKLGKKEWTEIAKNAGWTMTRMNLNTFQRHKVFDDPAMVKLVADRLRNREEIQRSRCFPYQLMMAYKASGGGATATRRYAGYGYGYGSSTYQDPVKNPVPMEIQEALQDALDIAVENVPQTEATMYVCPDVSGSMNSPVTGFRKGSTTKVSCVEVGALITAALCRQNKKTGILPFDTQVHNVNINPRDSVMTNAQKLNINGGGTDCSLPLRALNSTKAIGDLVIFISDYESWADSGYGYGRNRGSSTMQEWAIFKQRNPAAKMICINLVPTSTKQTKGSDDIVQVAGFSDQVFHLIAAVAKGEAAAGYWVDQIKLVGLNEPREKSETV